MFAFFQSSRAVDSSNDLTNMVLKYSANIFFIMIKIFDTNYNTSGPDALLLFFKLFNFFSILAEYISTSVNIVIFIRISFLDSGILLTSSEVKAEQTFFVLEQFLI